MKLTEYLEPLAYDTAFWMSAFQNADYPLDQLGDVTINVTEKLRVAAIISLLTKGDPDLYYHNLIRSGRCRVAYLTRLRDANRQTDHHQASGRVAPFLDAVAAADFALAREIIQLSVREWLKGHEYEDDYCYAQILHGLIGAQPDRQRLTELLERYAQALDGRKDARLPIAKAIFDRDASAFESAFEELLAQRTTAIEVEKGRNKIEEPAMIAERQIFVDGLALLRIAERLGFATQPEYLYCPSLARVPMRNPFPGE